MQLTLLLQPDGLTIRVDEKRLDAAIATAFKDRVRGLIARGGPHVTLDLGGVEFMDSSGLGAVIAIYKAMPPGRQLTLTGLTPNVERVFQLTRMHTVLTIRKTGDAPEPPGDPDPGQKRPEE
ncbi:STAS domain-containing protein [Paracoccus denitrificans]|jgi:anti-sigma B factor antagonist|uniref:Anti-sigma factor antagonist n=1 Tax=Paracoccus denitrificans (strain Pd 1222) TaxID=318586 RepID=A1B088_PARDP|nr:STAS domain-containing protein [Paracoccus denitrificans]ABL68932.1 anti-sigma-factor antagonist [Paracoccus denitrificans PD1222]MBB4625342.1 anti-sigma B factor antagonist [Paracoccus denitrificans]MCU7428168.1 STAS domain-containing protein [Paracoccus denitrificans]QAR26976.1 anti-sigma factor antagonist [Paracoccus denitrificans]UPV95935.1 STAS domain-containing protein [Paracoccus denitrificans]